MSKLTDTIETWMAAEAKMKYWKAEEMRLRLMIADPMLKGKRAGTHTVVVDNYQCKPVKKYNTSIDEETYEKIEDKLSPAEQGCIRTKHELAMKKYNALDKELKATLNECITTKPATPSLAIKDISPTNQEQLSEEDLD